MQRNLRTIFFLFLLLFSFLGLRLATIACVLLPLPTVLDAYETADVVSDSRAVVSPDGKWIAFTSNADGNRDLRYAC